MLKISKNGLILHKLVGSFGFSQIFFVSPPHPTSSPSVPDGDRKFWVPPPIKNLEKKPWLGILVPGFCGFKQLLWTSNDFNIKFGEIVLA